MGQDRRTEQYLVSSGFGEQTVASCEGVQRKTMILQVVSLTFLNLHRVTLEEDLLDTRAELTVMMM